MATDGRSKVYHLTDDPRFKLNSGYSPEDNSVSINPRDGRRGLYVGRPEAWSSPPYNYKRPYVAELSVPAGAKEGGRWGGENFIPAEHFDATRVERVMPYDHYIRQEFKQPGDTEDFMGKTYDTGEALKPGGMKKYPDGFDVEKPIDTRDKRQWSDAQHRSYLADRQKYLHEVHGWGWNEFDENGGWSKPDDDVDFDDEGEFIRRDREGNRMTRGRYAAVSQGITNPGLAVHKLGAAPKTPKTSEGEWTWEEAPPGKSSPQDHPLAPGPFVPDPGKKTGAGTGIESYGEKIPSWEPLGQMQNSRGKKYDVRYGRGDQGNWYGEAQDPDIDHSNHDKNDDHEAVIKWNPYDGEIAWRGAKSTHKGGYLSLFLKRHLMDNLPDHVEKPKHSRTLTAAGRGSLESFYNEHGDPYGDAQRALGDNYDEDGNYEGEDAESMPEEEPNREQRQALEDHGFDEDGVGDWNKDFIHPTTGDIIESHEISPDGTLTVRSRGLDGRMIENNAAGTRHYGDHEEALEKSRKGFAERNLSGLGWTPHYPPHNNTDSGNNQEPLKWTKTTESGHDAPYHSTLTMPEYNAEMPGGSAFRVQTSREGKKDDLMTQDGDFLEQEHKWAKGIHPGGRADLRLTHPEFHRAVQEHFGRPAETARGTTPNGNRQESTPDDHSGRFGVVDSGWITAQHPGHSDPSQAVTPVINYNWDTGQYEGRTPWGQHAMPGRQMTLPMHTAATRYPWDEDQPAEHEYQHTDYGAPIMPTHDAGLAKLKGLGWEVTRHGSAKRTDPNGVVHMAYPFWKQNMNREYWDLSSGLQGPNNSMKTQQTFYRTPEEAHAGASVVSRALGAEHGDLGEAAVKGLEHRKTVDFPVETRSLFDRLSANDAAWREAGSHAVTYEEVLKKVALRPKVAAIPDEAGLKAAGIAVIAMDTGRVLMQQRALNPLHCPCGQGVTWDEMNGYQHDDGSVSHDHDEFYGQSVSDLLDQGHPDPIPCPCCHGTGDNKEGSECVACDGGGSAPFGPLCDPPCGDYGSDETGLDKTSALEFDPNEGTWEFPGGKLDPGESARAAAVREFREEVGQDLPPGVFVGAWVSPGGITVSAAAGWVDPGYREEFHKYLDHEVGYSPEDFTALPVSEQRSLVDGFGHYVGEDHPKDARYHLDIGGAGHQKVRTGTPGATVRVLRIEKPDGTGPFAYGTERTIPGPFEAEHPDNLYSLLNPYAEDDPDRGTMKQRQPYADGIPARYIRGRVFGFLPQHNVNDYFTNRMLKGLHDHGYGMSEYDVPGESIVHGRTQTAWRPQDATRVSHKPLTEHFPSLMKQAAEGFKLPKPPVYRQHHEVDPRALDDESAMHAYNTMAHDPYHPAVQHAYDALENETLGQWHDLQDAGLKVQFHDGGNDYPNSKAMTADVHNNGHLWTRHSEGDGLPTDHPMSRVVGRTIVHTPEGPTQKSLTLNDVFRAVHDVNGHAAGVGHETVGFGPKGEFNAWLRHRATYSDDALPALWNETRGQAAQLGPMTQAGIPLTEIPFVDQKAGVVPQHFAARTASDGLCVTPGRAPDDMVRTAAVAPVYKGFIYLIQKESDIDLGNREIANPDDPDGDMSEQSAWWEIEHAKENPALRKECKDIPWDELELWSDKSVRTNKEIKQAFVNLSMPRINDLEVDRRQVRTNPKLDPERQQSRNGPTIWNIGGDRYLEKTTYPYSGQNEFLSSLVGRALGADVSKVMMNPRSDAQSREDGSILTKIQPGYEDNYKMDYPDREHYRDNVITSTRGKRLGLVDAITNVSDHDTINHGWKPDPTEPSGYAPHSIDYEESLGNSQQSYSTTPYAKHFIDGYSGYHPSNPLTKRDLARGGDALRKLHPVFKAMGREDDHWAMMERWKGLAGRAAGAEGEDILPEHLPEISHLARESTPHSLMKQLPNGDVAHAYDTGRGRWVHRTFSGEGGQYPMALARTHETALDNKGDWQTLGYQPGYPRHTLGNPPEKQPRLSAVVKTAISWIARGAHPDCGCTVQQMKLMDQSQPVQGLMTDHGPHGGRIRWSVTKNGVAQEQGKARHKSWAEKDMLDAYGRVADAAGDRKEAAVKKATQSPTNAVYPELRELISAGRPEFTVTKAGDIPRSVHDTILGHEVPQYHQERGIDMESPQVYAMRSRQDHAFLSPVTHDKTGQTGYLRGITRNDPRTWRFYPEEHLNKALRGESLTAKSPIPADQRYIRQRATGLPGFEGEKPGEMEGDVPLDLAGSQIVEKRPDRWLEPRVSSAKSKPWWVYA